MRKAIRSQQIELHLTADNQVNPYESSGFIERVTRLHHHPSDSKKAGV